MAGERAAHGSRRLSRAFVKESDAAGELPERAVSAHPNLVTPRGRAAIEARVQELSAERQAALASEDSALRARVERELRYWSARRASARVVEPATATDRVRFGMRVRLESGAGTRTDYRLVGEAEADAARGLISWVSPLGHSLLGRQLGESVPFQGGEAEIVSIAP